MALVNVVVGPNTLRVGLPSELDIKRLLCALLMGDLNNLLRGPLMCITVALGDLLGRLPGGALKDALSNLLKGIDSLLAASGLGDILARLNNVTSQMESLYGLGAVCPIGFRLPRIGSILANMVASYTNKARAIIQSLAQFQSISLCIGANGRTNWSNMYGGSFSRLNNDIDLYGDNIPAGIADGYTSDFDEASTGIKGIIDIMNSGSGEDATNVSEAASLAFQLNGLYDRIGSYPIEDGNIVYDNIFKMFLDPDVYEALIGMQGGTTLITENQDVLDNCGRVVSTRTVVLQGDISTQPFDATFDATSITIPSPALGDFKFREESGQFKVNLLGGTNPVITLIKGRSYNIALETETIGINIINPATNALYNEGLIHEDGTAREYAQNKKVGYLTWNIPNDAPDQLRYSDVSGTQTNIINLKTVSVAGIVGGPVDPTNSFGVIGVIGEDDIQANSPGDTLTLNPGTNIAFLTDPTNNILTITATNESSIPIRNEGTLLVNSMASMNFVGPNVSATANGNNVTVTVSSLPEPELFNAFSNVLVGGITIGADAPGDSFRLTPGPGISMVVNEANGVGNITVSSTAPFTDQTSAANIGTGTGVFKQQVEDELIFRSIKAGTGILVTTDGNDITVSSTAPTDQTSAANIGTGTGVFKQEIGNELIFRSIKAGTGILVTTDGNDITVSSTAAFTDQTSAANIGTGTGVFKQQIGNELIFRSIKAGEGVEISSDGNDITVSSSSGQLMESGTATTVDVAFTNVTWTDILAPTINSSWFFEATFIGRRTGGIVERNAFKIEGVVDNTASTISLVGPPAKTTYQNNATIWDVDVSVVSNVLRFRVKGEADKTIKWTGWLRYQTVSDL